MQILFVNPCRSDPPTTIEAAKSDRSLMPPPLHTAGGRRAKASPSKRHITLEEMDREEDAATLLIHALKMGDRVHITLPSDLLPAMNVGYHPWDDSMYDVSK